jgi:hypothetical protein
MPLNAATPGVQASNKFAAVLVPLFEVSTGPKGLCCCCCAGGLPVAQRSAGRPQPPLLPLPPLTPPPPPLQDEDGRVKVWLTQRSAHLSSHRGEVCLPGVGGRALPPSGPQ